jgi:DNA/RNA-binding domain of Phe-tRNA-synthetase-like protein
MSDEPELVAAEGFVEPRVRAEFPGLRLCWMTVEARRRGSPRAVRQRLRALSDRFHGASVVAMRSQPVPHAYRAFFRQIGLDPDSTRIPAEEAAIARLLQGGFQSHGLLADALLIALVETGVPVWALNADVVDAWGLGIRVTVEGDRFGSVEQTLAPGRLAVADTRQVHALLFGTIAPGHGVERHAPRVMLFAIGVDGVPAIHIDEALWTCSDLLSNA